MSYDTELDSTFDDPTAELEATDSDSPEDDLGDGDRARRKIITRDPRFLEAMRTKIGR